jgi:hypothetical protein
MVAAGEYHDQPARRAEQRQGADPAGCDRIHVNDNPFAHTEPQSDIDRRPVHAHLPMR